MGAALELVSEEEREKASMQSTAKDPCAGLGGLRLRFALALGLVFARRPSGGLCACLAVAILAQLASEAPASRLDGARRAFWACVARARSRLSSGGRSVHLARVSGSFIRSFIRCARRSRRN